LDAFAEANQAERRREKHDDEEEIDDIHFGPLTAKEVSARLISKP
jgi:hypothetical protein